MLFRSYLLYVDARGIEIGYLLAPMQPDLEEDMESESDDDSYDDDDDDYDDEEDD